MYACKAWMKSFQSRHPTRRVWSGAHTSTTWVTEGVNFCGDLPHAASLVGQREGEDCEQRPGKRTMRVAWQEYRGIICELTS